MRFERAVRLRGGETVLLRSLRIDDAECVLSWMRRIMGESRNMMRYPDEVTLSVQREEENIREQECSARALLIGAFLADELVGTAHLAPIHPADRVRHRAGIGLSVTKAHWHKGIASVMMKVLVDTAKKCGYEQLELEVVADNTRAIALYERFGFQMIGRHPKAFKYRDDSYADLLSMMAELK